MRRPSPTQPRIAIAVKTQSPLVSFLSLAAIACTQTPSPRSGDSAPSQAAPTANAAHLGLASSWPSAACQSKVEGLLSQMSVAEKAGQMVETWQANASPEMVAEYGLGAIFSGGDSAAGATGYDDRGKTDAASWAKMLDAYHAASAGSRLGIPVIYGIDAVHGNSKTKDATIFPHNIGLGCAGDLELAEKIGQATAKEVSAIGVNWVYGPSNIAAADERWGRFFESYSEDPTQTGLLAAATTRGLQDTNGAYGASVVACAKHFAGDGLTEVGTSTAHPDWTPHQGILDRGNVTMSEPEFRKLAVDHYKAAIDAGAGTVMATFSSWNGNHTHGNHHLLTEILKDELGFKGFVTGDYLGHEDLKGTYDVQLLTAFNAGVDMVMEPIKWKEAIEIIVKEAGKGLPMSRIDDAVSRILTVKCDAGLFENKRNEALMSTVGSAEHRALAREAVRKSSVLLQNNKVNGGSAVLPLAKGTKIYLGGSGANDLTRQCGGWTISWQGSGSETTGTTLRQSVEKFATVVDDITQADTAIVVLSEVAYGEWFGDDADIEFDQADIDELTRARASGKPTVAVMFSGRPMIISKHLPLADAWLAAWLPGTEGDGLTDVLFGDYAPTGKLSHSWPRDLSQLPLWRSNPGYDPLFPYGFGLTYPSK